MQIRAFIYYGEGTWESNPPKQLLTTLTSFEDWREHQNPSTPMRGFLKKSL